MTGDSHNPLSLPEESPALPAPRRPRKSSKLLLLLGIVCMLVGGNQQFGDAIGNSRSRLIASAGALIFIWAGISLARARPIPRWFLFVVGMPLLLFMIVAFLLSPQFAVHQVRRGNICATQGEFGKAINEFTKAIEWDPKLAAAYYNRGNAYVSLNDHGKAIADYTKAIKIDPGDAEYYNNRGAAYLMAEDYQSAVNDFTEAIRLNDRLANPYLGRSAAFDAIGDTGRSEADLAKAKQLNPSIGKD